MRRGAASEPTFPDTQLHHLQTLVEEPDLLHFRRERTRAAPYIHSSPLLQARLQAIEKVGTHEICRTRSVVKIELLAVTYLQFWITEKGAKLG